jgi:hypothetical protein
MNKFNNVVNIFQQLYFPLCWYLHLAVVEGLVSSSDPQS